MLPTPFVITVTADPGLFAGWLDHELYLVFGRSRSNRSISLASGLAANALYRVLTKGDRPSREFCERIAAMLSMAPEVVLRRAGLLPLAQMRVDPEAADVALADDARRVLQEALSLVGGALA